MRTVANILILLGVVAVGYWAVVFIGARLYQTEATRRFTEERRAVMDQSRNAQPDKISPADSTPGQQRTYPGTGAVVGTLAIPRLGLSTVVVEGTEERQLGVAAGHIPGTSLPGHGANVGVAAHRDTFFRPLQYIRTDDTIKVTTLDRDYHYRVDSTKIVEPDDVSVLYPTKLETLTLVTCYPFHYVGAAPSRFIVRAECLDCSR